jgi:hypothetical protein
MGRRKDASPGATVGILDRESKIHYTITMASPYE